VTVTSKSQYLENDYRLGDVIAAIQVMGSYSFYKLTYEKWAHRISGEDRDEKGASHWKKVFEEHPEFFRLDTTGQKASLVWRRSYRRIYSVDQQKELEASEISTLDDKGKNRLSRSPLTGEEISILINTAINLHTRAIEQNKEHRFLSVPLFGLLGVVLGAAMGVLVNK